MPATATGGTAKDTNQEPRNNETMSNGKKQPFKDAIKSYLDERAKTDELFAKTYAKEGKTLEECCNYIIGEARKRGNAVAMTDDEVFGLAVHYYDEDDIKVFHGSMSRKTEDVKVSLSAEEMEEARKEARQRAIDRMTEEQYALLKKKPSRGKKEAETEVQQMSLF